MVYPECRFLMHTGKLKIVEELKKERYFVKVKTY